jgi:hypothetical protein
MNINNNINNNNNNNNNNDRNNNNNNNFEAMNMNSRGFGEEVPVASCVSEARSVLAGGASPWSPEVFVPLAAGGRRGLPVLRAWLEAVTRQHPVCLAVLPCLAASHLISPALER